MRKKSKRFFLIPEKRPWVGVQTGESQSAGSDDVIIGGDDVIENFLLSQRGYWDIFFADVSVF